MQDGRVRSSLLLFLLVFGLSRAVDLLGVLFSASQFIIQLANLPVQVLIIALGVFFVVRRGSDSEEYGFWWPEPDEPWKYLSNGVLFGVVYIFITTFLPGAPWGFELLPVSPQIVLLVITAILMGFAVEIVFRGYIHTNLTKVYGSSTAIIASSLLFSLYSLQIATITSLNLASIYSQVAIFAAAGIFLAIFYQKTKTLVGPVMFQITILVNNLMPFKPAISQGFEKLFFDIIAYFFLVLFLNFWIVDESEEITRTY